MSFTWQNLGSFLPNGAWLPFLQTQGKSELFRLTFDLPPRYWGKYNNPVLLSFRYYGENQSLPPSPPLRIFPESRGILLEIPFARWASYVGCNSRIFEVKKTSTDSIKLSVQLEEMLLNVPPPDDNNNPPDPVGVQLQPGNIIYTWQTEEGYTSKRDFINFPLFTTLTKLSSNLPLRVRLYPNEEMAIEDAARPPYINPENDPNRGIFLDAILSSNQLESQLPLLPPSIVVNSNSVLVLDKLFPESGTINIRFDYIA